jgi:RNA polymerase sigma factor (sigma-70 family)
MAALVCPSRVDLFPSHDGPGAPTEAANYVARGEHASLLRFAYALTHAHAARAEDLVQDALSEIWRHRDQLVEVSDFDAYARVVVLNGFRSQWRRRWTREVSVAAMGDRPSENDDFAATDDIDEVWRLVRRLPPRQQAALALRYLEDRDYTAIAAIMGCRESTARALVSRALSELRRRLPTNSLPPGSRKVT